MNIVLDAGALIAIDRDDRRVAALIQIARRSGGVLVTPSPVVTQAWRKPARQALLARSLKTVDIRPVDEFMARRGGELLGESGLDDAVDAYVALLANPGDQVLTSDVDDIKLLLNARDVKAIVVKV
jgi:predicted nucleic acid-binding protein